MAQKDSTPIRKRAQIEQANKVMFIWVISVSVLLGFAVVGSFFLIQMLIFNEKVMVEKSKTVKTLESNLRNVEKLGSEIKVLDTDKLLMAKRAKDDDKAVQVVLDALPSEGNSLALGASLQQKLLGGIEGLTLGYLNVDSIVGLETESGDSTSVIDSSSAGENEITFSFSVSGKEEELKKVLTNLERSIRPISIIFLKIESNGDQRIMKVQAKSYYQPERTVELTDKVIK